jgi:hypothetical protein
MNLSESKSFDNKHRVTTHEQITNELSVSDDLEDLDLENLLYACTAGGELGRAAAAYFQRYIAQSFECLQHAERVLAAMEARQRGGRR